MVASRSFCEVSEGGRDGRGGPQTKYRLYALMPIKPGLYI